MREALAFLTILPVGARDRPPGRGSLLAFPLVGLALGAVWALAGWGATRLWGPLVATSTPWLTSPTDGHPAGRPKRPWR